MGNLIELDESLLIGQGCHKKVYAVPQEPDKCVKIIYNADGQKDIKRELSYRSYRRAHNMPMDLVPKYYGTVETNLGRGYLYERITDADGKPSVTLRDCVRDTAILSRYLEDITAKLLELRRRIMDENWITMGITDENIIFRKEASNEYRVCLISDLGTADFIPVTRIRWFAVKKIRRKWQRLVEDLQREINDEQEKYLTALIKAIRYE